MEGLNIAGRRTFSIQTIGNSGGYWRSFIIAACRRSRSVAMPRWTPSKNRGFLPPMTLLRAADRWDFPASELIRHALSHRIQKITQAD